MSAAIVKRKFGFEIGQFSDRDRPKKYIGTWYWHAGDSDSFCFFIEESSHKRNYRSKAKSKPYSGAIIPTRTEAIRQARKAAAKLQAAHDAKREAHNKALPDSITKHLNF